MKAWRYPKAWPYRVSLRVAGLLAACIVCIAFAAAITLDPGLVRGGILLRSWLALSSAGVAMSTLALGAAAGRARALKEANELLPRDHSAKPLLLGRATAGTELDIGDRRLVAEIAVLLDRAAAIARHEGAINPLLERYWDWYVGLYVRHSKVLEELRNDKRDVLITLTNAAEHANVLRKTEDWNGLWLYHLHAIRPIVYQFVERKLGLPSGVLAAAAAKNARSDATTV